MGKPKLDDPDLPLADLISLWPETVPIFLKHGMLCVGCVIGPFHTIVDACAEYRLDQDSFLNELLVAVSGAA